jgi:superfamily II DNA/RNA helicase
VIQVDHSAKPSLLAQLLKEETVNRALVFTRTKHGADKVVKGLERAGIPAEAIHGNKSQNHRERTLAAFRSGQIRTLVATDIAARGIDVDGVSHVVNFDLPNVPETYVHRIGRTARAGNEGIAISLVAGGEELGFLRDIERLIRVVLPREDRRTPGHREAAPAPAAHHRGGRPNPRADSGRNAKPHGHKPQGQAAHGQAARPNAGAPTNDGGKTAKGPRRRRPSSANINALPGNRQEPHRTSQGGGQTGTIQGVAFLHREGRPANRTRQPN